MTRQEAFDKAKALSLTDRVRVDEASQCNEGMEFTFFAVAIDGVQSNCKDSYEECFSDLIPKLQEGRIKRAEQLRKELEAAEKAIKKAL